MVNDQTMQETSPSAEKVPEETIEQLTEYKKSFESQKLCAEHRLERTEMLLKRNSAKKWDTKKKQRMMRRHIDLTKRIDVAEHLLDQVGVRLKQLEGTADAGR